MRFSRSLIGRNSFHRRTARNRYSRQRNMDASICRPVAFPIVMQRSVLPKSSSVTCPGIDFNSEVPDSGGGLCARFFFGRGQNLNEILLLVRWGGVSFGFCFALFLSF